VNLPMIRNWAEAIGDANPVYADAGAAARSVHGGLVAPPAMAQVWTMGGLHPVRDGTDDDPLHLMSAVLDEAGFTSVVATNCEQEYHRYLRPGEHVAVSATLESVAGPKRTALGEGWFVTTRSTWYVGTEAVATMLFRLLKYRPPDAAASSGASAAAGVRAGAAAARAGPGPSAAASGDVLRPAVSPDTRFFWDGTAAGELRIQRCSNCKRLRFPPRPMCPYCNSLDHTWDAMSGKGRLWSFVVPHPPLLPAFMEVAPYNVVVVELDEDPLIRLVGNLLETPDGAINEVDPETIRIGEPVQVVFQPAGEDVFLPRWVRT
jgi:hypothetical protein